MDISKYKSLYIQEAREHLSGIESGLGSLEKDPGGGGGGGEGGDPETGRIVDALFRHYHTIKGMSASMGYEPIQSFSHAQEDLLDRVRSGRLAITREITSLLFQCLDELSTLVDRVEADAPLDFDIEPSLRMIKEAGAEGAGDAPKGPARAAAAEPAAKGVAGRAAEGPAAEAPVAAEAREARAESPTTEAPPAASSPRGPELKLSDVMKVEGAVFDDLLAGIGELFMALSSLKSLSAESRSIALKENVYLLGKTVNKLHGGILSARMLPLSDLTEGLPRVVRDISRKSGKEVDLSLDGAELRLDRSVLEDLGAPLVHIIRNAVDHGIESVEDRNRAGKPPGGSITIKASPRKDHVVLTISDDGRGIDIEKIKEKAVERGMDPEEVGGLSDPEALRLICLPGLTSAERVSETSGRGVGMDVVKETVEAIGGRLEVRSALGRGTEIILELPRTSSIIKALSVTAGGERFLLPLSRIDRVIELHRAEVFGNGIFVDGEEVPVVSLAGALGLDDSQDIETCTVLIVRPEAPGAEEGAAAEGAGGAGRSRIGLKVDNFGDEMDAYVRPLTPPLSRLWGVSGVTVMGDGRTVFLLDVGQIASRPMAA